MSSEPAEKAPSAAPARKPAAQPALSEVPRPQMPPARLSGEPGRARFRRRHWVMTFSFLLFVLAPFVVGVGYLYTRAADQYHSVVGFSVHSEEQGSPLDILGAITQSGKSSASDADILYEFIRSQQIVEEISAEVDLIEIFNRANGDFVFTLGQEPTIEDLHWYWEWMVAVGYDSGTGIIEVEVRAFTSEDAHTVATAIVNRSTALINRLSQEAREDEIRFASRDLAEAEERLRGIRRELRAFRDLEQKVDPTADFQQRMGLLSALEQELARTLINRDVLAGQVGIEDVRVRRMDDEIAAIERRIASEKARLGTGGGLGLGTEADRLAEIVGTYEELVMDREFAEQAYQAVLAAYEKARTEARRQHRYLATHVGPTRAQEAIYPRRWLLTIVLAGALLSAWLVLVLVAFNAREAR